MNVVDILTKPNYFKVESTTSTITVEDANPSTVRYYYDYCQHDCQFFHIDLFLFLFFLYKSRTLLDYLYTGRLPQDGDENGSSFSFVIFSSSNPKIRKYFKRPAMSPFPSGLKLYCKILNFKSDYRLSQKISIFCLLYCISGEMLHLAVKYQLPALTKHLELQLAR